MRRNDGALAAGTAADPTRWAMQVHVAYTGIGGTRYHADLFCQDEWVARIAMSQAAPSLAAASSILSERCRDWIARYEQRERIGDTSFQILRG